MEKAFVWSGEPSIHMQKEGSRTCVALEGVPCPVSWSDHCINH